MGDLLTDDLTALLSDFPNPALHEIVGILKAHLAFSPMPARRAAAAHAAEPGDNLVPSAGDLAREMLWWGSSDVWRQLGYEPTWREVVANTAKSVGVSKAARAEALPAWRVEQALIETVLKDWERLDERARADVLERAGGNFAAAPAGIAAAAGGLLKVGGADLLGMLGAEGVGAAVGGALLGPALAALGGFWAVYELAGPSNRVLRPLVLTVAVTRRHLRDDSVARSFRD